MTHLSPLPPALPPSPPAQPSATPQAVAATATIPIPKPLPRPGEEPDWMNFLFAALSLVALILAVVWLRRRGRGPWR